MKFKLFFYQQILIFYYIANILLDVMHKHVFAFMELKVSVKSLIYIHNFTYSFPLYVCVCRTLLNA